MQLIWQQPERHSQHYGCLWRLWPLLEASRKQGLLLGQPSMCVYAQRTWFLAAGTKAAERAAAKAAKLQEQVDFEATFADMSEQEIALIAFRAKPPVVSQAKKKKLAKEEEARLKVQLGLLFPTLARSRSTGPRRICA